MPEALQQHERPGIEGVEGAAACSADSLRAQDGFAQRRGGRFSFEKLPHGEGQLVPARGGERFEDVQQLLIHDQPSFPAARRSAHFTPSTAAERMPPA